MKELSLVSEIATFNVEVSGKTNVVLLVRVVWLRCLC